MDWAKGDSRSSYEYETDILEDSNSAGPAVLDSPTCSLARKGEVLQEYSCTGYLEDNRFKDITRIISCKLHLKSFVPLLQTAYSFLGDSYKLIKTINKRQTIPLPLSALMFLHPYLANGGAYSPGLAIIT